MVWSTFTSSTKSYLVLFPPNKRTAVDFVEIICEGILEHYYWHHELHQHLILMEDGAPVHHSNTQKLCTEQFGLTKLE